MNSHKLKPKNECGSGYEYDEDGWVIYRKNVYEYLFYNGKKWTFNGQSCFFNGSLIHYSDFMRAKRGSL
jgi:hypothetical protein